MSELIKELIEKTTAGKLTWTARVNDLGQRYYYNERTGVCVFHRTIRIGDDIIHAADSDEELDGLREVIITAMKLQEADMRAVLLAKTLAELKKL